MKYFLLFFLIFFIGIGCATIKKPGTNIDGSFARSWGCNPIEVRTKATQYNSQLTGSRVFIPQVGWDVCELMARNGNPEEIDRQSGYGTRSATWWYGRGLYQDLWMITLVYSDYKWVVDYVSH